MRNPRRQKVYCGMLILVIAVIFVGAGCASREKVETIPAAVSHNLIKKIVTEDSDEGKRIIIEGEVPLAYAFFRLIPQPLKLVLDIPQSELDSGLTTPISVDDEVIKEIIAIQHDDDVEVSIHLHKLVRYKVHKEGNLLSIDVGRQSPLLAKEEEQKGEEIEIVKEIPPPVQEEVITKELAPAKSLVDVFVDTAQKDRVVITLKADGKLGDYNSFDLQKPTRLVIDLWKITRKFREKTVSVNSPYLKGVRLGDHPKKVRVVLDVPTTVLPSHRIDRMDDKLMIVMGKEVKEEELLIAPKEEIAQEPAREVAEEEKKITPPTITGEITGIDFKQLGDKSRLIISTSEKAPYEVVETGLEHTVLIEIQGMIVPPRLSRPLDTHEFASPVFMITPINVTVGTQKNTQIFVKLRKMVTFDTQQEDNRIYLDFERPAEFAEKPKPEEVITVKEPPTKEEMEEPVVAIKEELPVREEKVPPPAPQAEPVLPPEEEVEKVYTGKKITLDFKEADIHNILRLFAEVSDLNIITTDDVKGKVTVRLVDVPWDQALDILLQANNLGVERIGNVIRIAPLGRLSAEKKAKADAIKATKELEPLVSEVIPISYGDVTEIGSKGVKPILSERGNVVVDVRTNTLVVTDIRSNVEKAKELVRTLDAQTPQVLIQAKVIEANLDFGRELGIQWGGSFSDQTQAFGEDASVSTAGSSGGFGSGGWAVDLPATVGSGAGGAIEFAIANLANTKYLQARISALEEKGQGEIISSPRLTTLDNTEASIEQGLRIPYLKLTEEGTITTEFIEANLKLTVTPHVTADGHVRMEIIIKKDTPDESIVVEGVPSIDKKEVQTEVLVKDGEVVVIGGIYTYTKTSSVDAVPLFYKIPLLGWLFQKQSKDDNKKELLIFIAPRIVQPRRVISS